MHPQGHPSILLTVLIVALIAWRLYARFRRMVGRQRLSKWRPWVTVTLFPLFLVMLAAASWHQPSSLWALGGGAIAGIGLGILGLKLTKFETTPAGAYYTPSAHLGIGLSTLLAVRIAYRFIQMSDSASPGAPPTSYTNSPITLLIFGALALYYVSYAVGLIRWNQAGSVGSAPAAQAES